MKIDDKNMYDGLKKRELYAAMAMQSLIQSKTNVSKKYICKSAVEYANSLIEELENIE